MKEVLFAQAARILAEEGIKALSARRLSAAAGASTKVIYSHFGGMPGVIKALYDMSFLKLAAEFRASSAVAPNLRLEAVVEAYRSFAKVNPDLFDLIYGAPIATLLPTQASRAQARPALQVLIDLFSAQGPEESEDLARAFWASMHGIVALERTDWFDAEEATKRLSAIVADHRRFVSVSE